MIAFFPGKFHPPHLGHAKTILSLIPKYDKLIVAVSGDLPDITITNTDIIFSILKDLFEPFTSVEVIKFEGVLTQKSDLSNLPIFDVLLSGNPEVLAWADKMNIASEFIPRSDGYFFSGTEIRDELRNS